MGERCEDNKRKFYNDLKPFLCRFKNEDVDEEVDKKNTVQMVEVRAGCRILTKAKFGKK